MTMTFAPGVNPSFEYEVPHQWAVDEQAPIKPYVQTIPRALRPERRIVTDWILTRQEVEYILSFFHEIRGPAGEFYWTPLDPVFSPLHRAPDLAQVTKAGAPGAGRTYFVKFTWYDSTTGGETEASPVDSISVLSGNVVQVTVPVFPAGADRFRVYAGTVSGSEWLQAASSSRTWEEPITGLLTLTALAPEANSLKVPMKCALVGDVSPVKKTANRYGLRLEFRELWI